MMSRGRGAALKPIPQALVHLIMLHTIIRKAQQLMQKSKQKSREDKEKKKTIP